MAKEIRYVVLIFLMFLNLVVRGDDSIGFSQAIQRLHTKDMDAFRASVDSILENLEKIDDFRLKVLFTKQVSDITAQKDELAHIRSLCHKAIYSDTGSPALFDEALHLAKKNKSLNWMQYVEDRWARYYLANRQYDSAMIHILKMKDMWPKENRDAQYLNILHLLGDMYFNAGLYDMADSLYQDIYRHYLQHGPLDFWRPYVVINNLGLIQMKKANFQDAINWFNSCLTLAQENLHQSYKENLLAYTKTKIADAYLNMGNFQLATKYLRQAEEYPNHLIFDDSRYEIHFLKSRLFLSEGNTNEALQLALKLIPPDTNLLDHKNLVPDIYLLISDAYSKLHQPDSSLKYLNKYMTVSKLIEQEGSMARSMIIFAEKEHAATKHKLQVYRKRYINVLLGMFVLIALIIFILALFRSIYRSKMLLLENLLEKSKKLPLNTNGKRTTGKDPKETEKQQKLITELEQLMKNNRPYLDPGLNIKQTAEMLSTNRTYLSIALNEVLEKSFPNYINEYRIAEAVKLVKEDFISNHTIEALAYNSGFTNRSVFTSVFKKQTGMTPGFFVKNYKRKQV